MSETPFINLRNETSGVTVSYSAEDADKWLAHPVFGQHLKVVRTDKAEVLAPKHDDKDSSKNHDNKDAK